MKEFDGDMKRYMDQSLYKLQDGEYISDDQEDELDESPTPRNINESQISGTPNSIKTPIDGMRLGSLLDMPTINDKKLSEDFTSP